jgi:hypothetical protein
VATPERASGWLGVLLPLLDKSTPITLLLALVIGALMGWYMLDELSRLHDVNRELFSKLEAAQQAQIELALRCKE